MRENCWSIRAWSYFIRNWHPFSPQKNNFWLSLQWNHTTHFHSMIDWCNTLFWVNLCILLTCIIITVDLLKMLGLLQSMICANIAWCNVYEPHVLIMANSFETSFPFPVSSGCFNQSLHQNIDHWTGAFSASQMLKWALMSTLLYLAAQSSIISNVNDKENFYI